jgi:RNA polymerase sigma factor (sigma-70 family)
VEAPLSPHDKQQQFEAAVLPHLDAAYNLARWLTRNDHDAEDLVQEAYLRAFKFFGGFHGIDARAWLMAVVRNTCYTWLKQRKLRETTAPFDEEMHSGAGDAYNPEKLALQHADRRLLRDTLEELPVEYREVIVLRELEGFSYKDIAVIADIPLGTVMSRLTRARKRLEQHLVRRLGEEGLT